jgi:hypothetical protein
MLSMAVHAVLVSGRLVVVEMQWVEVRSNVVRARRGTAIGEVTIRMYLGLVRLRISCTCMAYVLCLIMRRVRI